MYHDKRGGGFHAIWEITTIMFMGCHNHGYKEGRRPRRPRSGEEVFEIRLASSCSNSQELSDRYKLLVGNLPTLSSDLERCLPQLTIQDGVLR